MKNIHNKARKRSFRRWLKQVFSAFMGRQDYCGQQEIAEAIELLREIEESIEIIAREIARQAKRRE